MKRKDFLEKKFIEINQKMAFFSEDTYYWKSIVKRPRIPLPHFMVDPDSLETKELKEQYRKERDNMKRIFAKPGFVEATLQQLMDK